MEGEPLGTVGLPREERGVSMYLIAGLGNPGREYAQTRHNVGFLAADYLARCYNIHIDRLKFKGALGEGRIGGEKCIILKPHTFMNLSGESVRDCAEFYKIPPENIIVMYDDVALNVGAVRIRPGGSAGGHNGMKSIIYLLNTDRFPRVRFGVGSPEHDMINHVLGKFSQEDGVAVTAAIKQVEEIIPTIIEEGVQAAMNKFNKK